MFASMKRRGQPEPQRLSAIAFQKLVSSDDFFKTLQEALEKFFEAGGKIVEASVKRTSEPEVPGLFRQWTDFTMANSKEASNIYVGWETLLKVLERVYRRDGRYAEMELEVCLFVE
jgi:hypothetical protein